MNTIQKILLEFKPEDKNILPALKKISAVFGYVSEKDAKIVANYFEIEKSKVFETASFYDLVKVEKPAQITIQVCSSVNCALNNSFEIVKEIENLLKIKVGDQNNFKIQLEEISCLGRCSEGPIMVVNGKVYEKVTKSSAHSILGEYL